MSCIYDLRKASLAAFFEYRRMPARSTTSARPLVGRRLAQARERLGISQYKLGVLIGLEESSSSARISRYEAGIHEPPVAVALRLGVALQVPLAFLYCEDDDMADLLLVINRLTPPKRQRLLEYGHSIS